MEKCEWIKHCQNKPEFWVAMYGEELEICRECTFGYGLNDGDYWRISQEDTEE